MKIINRSRSNTRNCIEVKRKYKLTNAKRRISVLAESSKTSRKIYRENYFPSTEFKVAEPFKRLKKPCRY